METWKYIVGSLVFFALFGIGAAMYFHEPCTPLPGQRYHLVGAGDVFVKYSEGYSRAGKVTYSPTGDNKTWEGTGSARRSDFCSNATLLIAGETNDSEDDG